jgi:glycosyltransferase involved in cell wall biosynthesis
MNLALAHPLQVAQSTAEVAPIRILIVTDTPLHLRGGSERFLCNLLVGLDPTRYAVDVVQMAAAAVGGGDLPASLQRPNIRLEYHPVDAVYGRAGIALYRELRRRVLSGRYQFVQSQHEKSDLICALLPRAAGCRLRVSNRRDSGFQKSGKLRLAFRLLNPRFDRFVAPSRAVLDGLVDSEAVAAERTVCLPNGVDTERFAPVPLSLRAAGRVELGLPPHAFLFGCVARLVEVKRHCDLLDGFAAAARQRPDTALVLVGGGPLQAELRARAERLDIADRVLFLGERNDIERLLPLFDAFALCSRTEGMSNAVLEAMACGLPCVATAVGGNPETLDRHTGLLVPPFAP